MKKGSINIYDFKNETETAPGAEELAESRNAQELRSESVKKGKGSKKPKKRGRLKNWVKKHRLLTALIALILVAAIVAGAVLLANSNSSTTAYSYIRTTTLTKGTLEESIAATGSVESSATSSVTTSLSYTIKTVNVAVGDEVSEGDVICTLDTSELEEQIEKEQENIEKAVESAQKSYDSALESYNDACDALSDYEDELADAKAESDSAYVLYNNAKNAVSSYQSAYDSALAAYNKAGAAYVKALSNYETALSNYKSGSATSDELISAAKKYVSAVQNYYGGCETGTYDISGGGSSGSTSSGTDSSSSAQQLIASASGDSSSSSSSSSGSSTSITVSETADSICDGVVSKVKSLTGSTISYSSGTNTLYKLCQKAKKLETVKERCNYSTLESEYTSAYSQYESAMQTYEQYEDAASSAKEQLESAQEQLEEAQTSDTLEELQSSLADCELTAGQDGTVVSLNATVGSSATGMDAVATIADLSKLKISITIQEADINNAEIGLSCNITSDASDETLTGTLTQIDPISSNNGSFGAEVTVDSETTELLVGMNASVEIIVSSTEDVYQVPIDAVGNDNDGNGDYVYRQTGGSGTDMTFEKVYVTTGEQNDYYIEIESDDLSEGDVIRSSADLSEGIETTEEDSSSDFDLSSLFGGGGDSGDSAGMSGRGGNMGNNSMPESGGNFSGGGF
ncbi:MAG: efflux RND transporter periplasmic adaptor subunit [Clostridiales bacterium]|nr:efflux RND transporter periplasmic adaptor subunit [Clostridiales bacterium]